MELTKNDKWDIEINWIVKIDYIPNEVVWETSKAEVYEMIKEALKVEAYSYGGKRVKREFFRSVYIKILYEENEE